MAMGHLTHGRHRLTEFVWRREKKKIIKKGKNRKAGRKTKRRYRLPLLSPPSPPPIYNELPDTAVGEPRGEPTGHQIQFFGLPAAAGGEPRSEPTGHQVHFFGLPVTAGGEPRGEPTGHKLQPSPLALEGGWRKKNAHI